MPRLAGRVAFITGAGTGDRPRNRDPLRARRRSSRGRRDRRSRRRVNGAARRHRRDRDPDRRDRAGEPGAGDPRGGRQVRRAPVLHNNAGGSTAADNTAVEAPLDEFWRAIKLDLYGTFLGCRFGIPAIIQSGGGSVINMSSNVALMGVPGRDCYTAAKGGIAAITRSLAVAYAAQRVRVNAIAPSATMTERVKRLVAGNTALQKLADSHLLGLIEPDDIAHMALYLASDESRMVTGQVLPVDSGVTIS